MSTQYQIPLIAAPQQLIISLGGTQYTLTVKWNPDPNANCWVIDIGDANNNLIIGGIAMVTGCDLLGQFAYLNFGGKLIASTTYDTASPPTFTNLGDGAYLYFVTTP
jgi:hypothetical protein